MAELLVLVDDFVSVRGSVAVAAAVAVANAETVRRHGNQVARNLVHITPQKLMAPT